MLYNVGLNGKNSWLCPGMEELGEGTPSSCAQEPVAKNL